MYRSNQIKARFLHTMMGPNDNQISDNVIGTRHCYTSLYEKGRRDLTTTVINFFKISHK